MGAKPVTWNFGKSFGSLIDFSDKESNAANYVAYMLDRAQSMLTYDGLPDTISRRNLSLMLQTNGWVCIPDPKFFDGKFYAFTGGLGGEPDPYYMPTICTVSNPALKFSKSLKIDDECVIIPHDSMYIGLLPMFSRYATQLAENDITMRIADINARMISLISAPDDRTKKSAEGYVNDIVAGKMGVIAENAFLDGIKTQPYSTSGNQNNITQLIELHQYLKAGWYNDIGLNANYNMKRESINSGEAQLNEDALIPLIDDILQTQKTAFEKLYKMYGLEIDVSLNSAWDEKQNGVEVQSKEGDAVVEIE